MIMQLCMCEVECQCTVMKWNEMECMHACMQILHFFNKSISLHNHFTVCCKSSSLSQVRDCAHLDLKVWDLPSWTPEVRGKKALWLLEFQKIVEDPGATECCFFTVRVGIPVWCSTSHVSLSTVRMSWLSCWTTGLNDHGRHDSETWNKLFDESFCKPAGLVRNTYVARFLFINDGWLYT